MSSNLYMNIPLYVRLHFPVSSHQHVENKISENTQQEQMSSVTCIKTQLQRAAVHLYM